jgi:hypothetical protein
MMKFTSVKGFKEHLHNAHEKQAAKVTTEKSKAEKLEKVKNKLLVLRNTKNIMEICLQCITTYIRQKML